MRFSIYTGLFLLLSFVAPPKKKITIWMVGDSTMSIKEATAWPETGWGVPFARFFDSSVTVSNHARNGRSTRTFITEGLWQKVIDNVQPGDYVFIQFGHNDEVPTKASATTPAEFKKNLERYISETKSKQAHPVLFTPMARRKFDDKGKIVGTHDQYAAIVRTVAKEMQLPLIDMDKKSQALLQQFGPDKSKQLFLWLSPGENPNYPQGRQDDTHFNELGARLMAQLVLGELKNLLPELTDRVGNKSKQGKKIIVARDGSGQFSTIQEAFNSIPAGNADPITVFVKPGLYQEKLVLDSTRPFITLVGENKWNTVISWNDHTGKLSPNGDTIGTRTSQSFLMRADNFTAENISFENTAGMNAGQAVAVQVHGDKAVFRNCRFLGHQDVLYTINPNSRQYYEGCYIEGTTDFIFGASTAWFEKCQVHSKRNSHITAASTPQHHAYGYIFNECILTADTALNNVTLGRPWRPYSSVTYINCYIDRHIIAGGWNNWRNEANEKTARYAEYNSFGPGANPAARLSWSKQLTAEERNLITIKNVFGDWDPQQKN
jgi:pectinesterase